MKNVRIFSTARDTIRRYNMLDKNDRVLLCVSGGPDSTFLAYALQYLKNEFGLKLYMAHLDHGIRGAASYDDYMFVKKLAGSFGIKLVAKGTRIKKDSSHSLEESARRARYTFFSATAKKYGVKKIATAHTRDDQAETVLMRVIKGTSLKGLTGIPPVRVKNGLMYIRPLIEFGKKNILEFLRKERLGYRIDASNRDNSFLRNAVRNEVLPYLAKYNPRITRALCNLADSLREDRVFFEGAKKNVNRRIPAKGKHVLSVALKDLVPQPRALQKEIVRDMLARSGCNLKKLSFIHWKGVSSLISAKASGKRLDLPGHVLIRKGKTELFFEKKTGAGSGLKD